MKFDEILANKKLPARKREFVESLKAFYEKNEYLTTSQEKYWSTTYDEYCVNATIKRHEWVEAYDDEKKAIAKICATYYLSNSTVYFQDLAPLEDNAFLPHKNKSFHLYLHK